MPTADEVLGQVTPLTTTEKVCVRGDLVVRIEQLGEQWQAAVAEDARENRPPTAPLIAEEIQAARAEAEAAEVAFTFQAIGSTAWAKLLADHPPPAGRGGSFNPETFPPAAISASLIEPSGFTVDKVVQLLEGLNDGAFQRLWGACLRANMADGGLPKFGPLFELTAASSPSSTTAPPEGSPTPSS